MARFRRWSIKGEPAAPQQQQEGREAIPRGKVNRRLPGGRCRQRQAQALGFGKFAEPLKRGIWTTAEHSFLLPHLMREVRGAFPFSHQRPDTIAATLKKSGIRPLKRSGNHGEAVVKLKKFHFGWHVGCVAVPSDDHRQSNLSHFDAHGVFRRASDSAGRSHISNRGSGSAACG